MEWGVGRTESGAAKVHTCDSCIKTDLSERTVAYPFVSVVEIKRDGQFARTHVSPRMVTAMPNKIPDVAGTAALSICESLLLALNDRKILPEDDIVGVLRDAAAAHANDPGDDGQTDLHDAVAALITRILAGGNSVRHR
jgi:hypothetical protein